MNAKIIITDELFKNLQTKVREKMLPHQWLALNDKFDGEQKSHAVRNLKIAAEHDEKSASMVEYGDFAKESDLCKWMEAAAYSLADFKDEKLENVMDELSDLFAKAQADDGYLNTYYIAKGEKQRFNCLSEMHELYCAGHLIEAAVAYYNATGKTVLLNAVKKYADYLCEVFGENGEKEGFYGGHEEIELALVKLYEATGEKRYLDLAKRFVLIRGTQPSPLEREQGFRTGSKWFDLDYYQADKPLKEQDVALGHAVRAVYFYCGATDVARITRDKELFLRLKQIWKDLTETKMYVTGGIGSEVRGERFGKAFDLPELTAYNETCASIGLALWCGRMLKVEENPEYADVMERALYNTVLSGVSRDGERYFYVNPLRVIPEVDESRSDCEHVKTERVKWFGCACCPPNIARTLSSAGCFVWNESQDELRLELWIGSRYKSENCEAELSGNLFEGKFTLNKKTHKKVKIRLPYWAEEVIINGEKAVLSESVYCELKSDFNEINIKFSPKIVYPSPLNYYSAGRVALSYGPFVYCLEEADNGKDLAGLKISKTAPIEVVCEKGFSAPVLKVKGERFTPNKAYSYSESESAPCVLTFVPYCDWNNRGKGEMSVYVR